MSQAWSTKLTVSVMFRFVVVWHPNRIAVRSCIGVFASDDYVLMRRKRLQLTR
jgi:hypothetical protein